MDIAKATQRAFDTEQLMAGLEASVRAFRGEWARQNSLLVVDNQDPEKVKPIVESAVAGIKNQADALGAKIAKDLDDIAKEQKGEDTTPGGGEDTAAGGGEDTAAGGGEDTTAGAAAA